MSFLPNDILVIVLNFIVVIIDFNIARTYRIALFRLHYFNTFISKNQTIEVSRPKRVLNEVKCEMRIPIPSLLTFRTTHILGTRPT